MADLRYTRGQCCNSTNLPFYRLYKVGVCYSWYVGVCWSVFCDRFVGANAWRAGWFLEMVGCIHGIWRSSDDNAAWNRYFFGIFGFAGDGGTWLCYIQHACKAVPSPLLVKCNSIQITDVHSGFFTSRMVVL